MVLIPGNSPWPDLIYTPLHLLSAHPHSALPPLPFPLVPFLYFSSLPPLPLPLYIYPSPVFFHHLIRNIGPSQNNTSIDKKDKDSSGGVGGGDASVTATSVGRFTLMIHVYPN